MSAPPATAPALIILLAFNESNQLAVRRVGGRFSAAFVCADLPMADTRLDASFTAHTSPVEFFHVDAGEATYAVCFTQVRGLPADHDVLYRTIEELQIQRAALEPALAAVLDRLDPFLIEIPYLHLGENDYIYKFRVERDRNRALYGQDDEARTLYQSRLCEAIKALARTNERTATRPAMLDFGAVRYVIPSHFGFCLGVKNAIERAYETLAENPGRRVFMLSELIHNPFVNEDLLRRGLRFLQTDKGLPYTAAGHIAQSNTVEQLLWDSLSSDDIVIIPAFGATDDDKRRLVRKGIRVAQYDATCMLVEKVWKAARSFGREGYTVVIHGKSEHEETKATFSNTRRHAHAIIIRNFEEARALGTYILHPTEAARGALQEKFSALQSPGFDPALHLDRIAVVNQTTLLMNETATIIEYFKAVYIEKYGAVDGPAHVGGGKKDTLCYATQVNQDALRRALDEPLDAAFIIGGKNSSNTYQLYRLCEQKLSDRAFFIQSEANIRSRAEIEHYVFPAAGQGGVGRTEVHPLWPALTKAPVGMPTDYAPKRVLLTGGASCPDGLIQQVIARINSFFPAERLRSVEDVLADLQRA